MDVPDATAPADASAPPAETAPAQPPAESAPATASTGQNPRLVGVRYGAPTGDEHPLLGQRLVVGRFDAETGPVDIDLSQAPESEQISRQHAEIYREADGGWFVKDLGSTNGVFVKTTGAATFGPRLTAPQALTSGDEIGFGNARFIFQTD
jgi:pSer/pThr/pTyr-binding forkhead associated (FHA) protein